MDLGNILSHLGSFLGTLMFLCAIYQKYFPGHIRSYMEKYSRLGLDLARPYVQVTFYEFTDHMFAKNAAYSTVKCFLTGRSTAQAKRLKAQLKRNQSLVLSIDEREEIPDEFHGVRLWWGSGKRVSKSKVQPFYPPPSADNKSYYKLTFHQRDRDVILGPYLNHVREEAEAIKARNRQRQLYTNNGSSWMGVVFEHRATFQTLAMEPSRKQEIVDDLITFSNAKDFYRRLGRAWKRGYLLHGPPGTGKSTMIAAMANLLGYDLYDLELTAVKDNTELLKLLIQTSKKSILVIEDIDCSLDLTGQRKESKKDGGDGEDKKDRPVKKPSNVVDDDKKAANPSKVTLSGLLNFIDGLWSVCRGERLIVFTTNHVEKLDPALIRRGRMDKHIELSYCRFEEFKVLAKNYLGIERHDLFERIEGLLQEKNMTPADVAEHLMPKTEAMTHEDRLESLIIALTT
ncbi:hypothetical protein SAY87_027549 [Trapa incisa]|uniref:AAA+ ATPase domain-containing protein n=1 Tax=Trapa incisa TaxID=236973 RepID=A0AAN7JMP7_9MYRT|nr:hypothetical protein SAY87_027549 [Trapa incisa]